MHSELFDLTVLPIRNKLFRYAYMLVNNRTEAEDIVQDALMKLWTKREELDKINNVEAWSMTIIKNLAYDGLRKKKNRNITAINPDDVKSAYIPVDTTIETREHFRHIYECIDLLPERQKQTIYLREIEGHSYKEIGKLMGIDENLVKITLFRARDNLRKKILKIENYGL